MKIGEIKLNVGEKGEIEISYAFLGVKNGRAKKQVCPHVI